MYYFDPVKKVRLLTPPEERDGRHKEIEDRVSAERARQTAEETRKTMQAERNREARLRRQETAARKAAEARVAELERQLQAE